MFAANALMEDSPCVRSVRARGILEDRDTSGEIEKDSTIRNEFRNPRILESERSTTSLAVLPIFGGCSWKYH